LTALVKKGKTMGNPTYFNASKEWADKPWARSKRCETKWYITSHNEYAALLPGSTTTVIRVRDSRFQRCPTTLDVSLICTVIALLSLRKKGVRVELGTYKDTLARIGYTYDSTNLAALKDSFGYLQHVVMTVRHGSDKRRLNPPFQDVAFEDGVLTVTVDKGFYNFATVVRSRKNRCRVPLPLPKDPVVQNLLFLVSATRWVKDRELGYEHRHFGKAHAVAAQVGISCNPWYRDLRRAMRVVTDIYARLRCKLDFVELSGVTLAVRNDLTRAGSAFKRTIYLVLHRDKAPTFKRMHKLVSKPQPVERKRERLPSGLMWEHVTYTTEDGRSGWTWFNRSTGEMRDEES
jgi:hypothetical protein